MKRLLWLTMLLAVLLVPAVRGDETTPAAPKGKPALLVMDIQNAFLPSIPEQHRGIGMYMINAAIDLFRKNGCPVIRVYHCSLKGYPAAGTNAFEFPADVHIQDGDLKVVKNYPSAFKKTDLAKILRDHGCDTVFVCGLSAVGCVLYTYIDAQNLDFRAFMIKDAIMSHRPDLTHSVEEITDAVGLEAVEYMLLNAKQ
jgi:nicotinamidase-related amidase